MIKTSKGKAEMVGNLFDVISDFSVIAHALKNSLSVVAGRGKKKEIEEVLHAAVKVAFSGDDNLVDGEAAKHLADAINSLL